MSDKLEYEIERYLATCLASDDPDAGYMADNVIGMCRAAIAAEIETLIAAVKYDDAFADMERSAYRVCARLVRRGEQQ